MGPVKMWLKRAPHLDIFSSPTEKDVKIAEDSEVTQYPSHERQTLH